MICCLYVFSPFYNWLSPCNGYFGQSRIWFGILFYCSRHIEPHLESDGWIVRQELCFIGDTASKTTRTHPQVWNHPLQQVQQIQQELPRLVNRASGVSGSITRSRKASKPGDLRIRLFCRFVIRQESRQQCCRGTCQITKRYDHLNTYSRSFDTLRYFMIRCLIAIETRLRWVSHKYLCEILRSELARHLGSEFSAPLKFDRHAAVLPWCLSNFRSMHSFDNLSCSFETISSDNYARCITKLSQN